MSLYLQSPLRVQQQIVQLDVPVQDVSAVTIVESFEELLEDVAGDGFLETASFADVGEEVAAGAEFLYIQEMLFGLEGLIESAES